MGRLCATLTIALRFFELPISQNFDAGEGIRTPERLHEQILSLTRFTREDLDLYNRYFYFSNK